MRYCPRCTKIYSVRKLANTRVRNFYTYGNFCDYSYKLFHLASPPPPPLHPLWTNLQPIHILFSSVQLIAIAFFAGVNRRVIGQLLAKSYNSCRRLCQLESAFTTMLWTNNHPIDLILLGFLQLKEKKKKHIFTPCSGSFFLLSFHCFFPESLRGTYISSRLSLSPLYYHNL